jgi:hypothetical protein
VKLDSFVESTATIENYTNFELFSQCFTSSSNNCLNTYFKSICDQNWTCHNSTSISKVPFTNVNFSTLDYCLLLYGREDLTTH